MSTKNSFIRWIGTPTKCYDFQRLNLKEENSTFYKSVLLNDDVYKLGEHVYVRISEETVVGRLLCFYESSQYTNPYRGVLRLYKFAQDCDIQMCKGFCKNEIVEHDIQKNVSLDKIKGKCTVIVGTEDDTLDDVDPGTYLLRYKFLKSNLVPIVSNEAINTTNIFNQFEKVLTPKCHITSKYKTISPSRIPYVKLCDSMKKVRIAESFATPKRLSVCRNLNESFDSAPNSQEGTPVLNYSLIENTATDDNDVSLRMKFRLSQNQQPFVPLEKIDTDVLNTYLDKNKENVMEETQGSVRRSTRSRQQISYAEFNGTPTKRGRKKSTDSDEIIFVNQELVIKTNNLIPSKQKVKDEKESSLRKITKSRRKSCTSYIAITRTPSKRKGVDKKNSSPSKVTRSTRKTRYSARENCEDIKLDSDVVAYIDMTNDINTTPLKRKDVDDKIDSPSKIKRSARKNHYSVKESLLQIDESQHNSPRKRLSNTPNKYRDYVTTPIALQRKSILRQPVSSGISTPKKSVCYKDYYISPNGKHNKDMEVVMTPKTPKNTNATTPKSCLKETPTTRAKLIRDGTITPSMQSRVTPVKVDKTPLNMAKSKLHVSYVPKVLVCREKEFSDIYNFIEGKLLDGCGGCMYVSGVPGTGKTATVTEVIKKLLSQVKSRTVPDFKYININGMRLSEPRQSYVEILRQLTGKSVRWEQAQAALDTKFTKTGNKNKPIVLVVDELDILCTKRQDVVYNLLDWPTKAKAQLIVITIANTMDLPERLLMGRVTSRLGLTRLTFQAYTHKQLQEIVTRRLLGTGAFNPDAVQLVARKVASVSGDARRALDICRRAAEIAELEGENTLVSMTHVNDALNTMITQPKVQAIKSCSRLQQLILQAIVAEVERTGVEETSFSDVYPMLISVAALDGFQMVTCTVVLRAISRLGACRLLLTDQKSHDYNQKIILNVSSDDVYYALRKD